MLLGLCNCECVFVFKYEIWLYKVGVGNFKCGDILIFKLFVQVVQKIENFNCLFLGLWNYWFFLIKCLIGLFGDKICIFGGEVYFNGVKFDVSWMIGYWQQQECWDM